MTRVLWLLSLSAVSVGALTACGSSDDKEDSAVPATGDDDDDDDDTATTTTTTTVETAALMTLSAEIAWDADSETAGTYMYQGYELGSTFIFRFGTSSWDGNTQNTSDYCTILLDVTGMPVADWAEGEGQFIGVDYGGGDVLFSDCDWIDTSVYFEGVPAEDALSGYQWGIGIGGPLAADIATAVSDQLGPEYLDIYGGGYVTTDFGGGTESDLVYFTANELDPDREIVLDASGYTTQIPLDSVGDASGVVSALYFINMFIAW